MEKQRAREIFVEAEESQMGQAQDSGAGGSVFRKTELKAVKEEVEELEMVDNMLNDCEFFADYEAPHDVHVDSSSSSSSAGLSLPKPLEGLHDSATPPFLRKTFEMVEDPGTDPIVSWSENRNSFVVWDSHTFSRDLLPKYFKHNNFSSFIRQLNTYGFRKIDTERWEFKNEGFQGGKKHLLKNIKRRSRYNEQHPPGLPQQQQQAAVACSDLTVLGLESQLEVLQKDQCKLQMEIMRLKQQQERSQYQLGAVEDCILRAERRQEQMFNFLVRVAKNPGFVKQLIQGIKQQRKELGRGQLSKKRKLLQTQVNKSSEDPNQNVEAKLASTQPEAGLCNYIPEDVDANSLANTFLVLDPTIQGQEYEMMCGGPAGMSGYNAMSQDLLDEDAGILETEADEELIINDTKIYLELEDLIGKPCGWGEQASELVEQMDCIGSIP